MKLLSLILFATLLLLTDGACPNKWQLNDGNCYYVSSEMFLNWADAVTFCKSINGTLTSVKSQTEYSYLKAAAVDTTPLYPIWIGLQRDPQVSSYPRWIWLDGSPANSSFFNQNPIQSDGCVSWRTMDTNNGFETISCNFQQPFVCKASSV